MKTFRTVLVALLCLVSGNAYAGDADYVLGVGDVLQLNVWQVPTLDRQLTVRPDGMVVLPMAGELRAAGRTLKQLEQDITSRLRDFNRNVSSVSLTVTEYQSRSIYVLGRVLKPGKYAFAEPINLFDLIREAGGFGEDAMRTRVKVVHRDGGEESIEYANVELAIDTGTLDKLPSVKAGDTVLVSKNTGAGFALSEGVQLIGAVRTPSIYPVEEVNDLVGILLLAGGPTDRANLKKVRLVRDDPSRGTVAHVINVKSFLEDGVASQNPAMQPGDTVFVPAIAERSWYRTLRTVSLLVGTVGSGVGLYYAFSN